MFPNVSLIQLRCFIGVVEHGGFTVAADRLCLSQSAVSQAVAALERALGTKLLLRGRDGLTLTLAGNKALAEARAALAAVSRLANCAERAEELSGTVRIGVVQSAAIRLLPGWLRRLRAEHPRIAVTLYEGTDPEVTGWVQAGIVEIGITSRTHPKLTARPVSSDDYLAVLPVDHPLASHRTVPLKALDGQRMLLSGGGCETLIEELLAAAASHPEIICLVRDNATLLGMVREGLGLTIMPELAIDDSSGIATLPLEPALRRTLHAVTLPAEALAPAALALLRLIESAPRQPSQPAGRRLRGGRRADPF
ncbi:MAG TPA: LysR family transcriptional regulator [Bosea sp. (in: a-proteobacteria)]|jgi:DNA-binding transcriptional LysR family regulator|nr:LysR family transcriptional regulator [Bosea sp. (in: a-proteobacteria)]